MVKLNLTDVQRVNIAVTFEVNKFVAYLPSGALLGKYTSKKAMKAEFSENGIKSSLDGIAQRKYLANYGD